VGPDTCEDSGNPTWDQACVPCDEAYDWARDYDWIAGTLDDGTTDVRPVTTLVERSYLTTDDGEGELDLYFIPSHGEVPELADTTILYTHGNYMGIEHYMPRVRFLHEAGYAVLVWDYRGFGKSLPDSAPTTDQFLADAHSMLAHARDLIDHPERIVVYANSLGSIPAVEMSLDDPPCALMLEATFTSVSRVSRTDTTTSFAESFFSQNRFDNVAKLEGYEGALFVLVGDEDNFFLLEDQEAMYDAATGPKEMWVVPGAKHGISNGGVPEAGLTQYFEAIGSFLEDTAPTCL
jgi:pimeloyl-ACP methyl ester carboxylesterase